MSNKIIVRHTSIIIPEYTLGDCPRLESMLSVYNKTCYKFDPKGLVYNEAKNELRIPSGLDMNMVASMLERNIEMCYTPDEYVKASYNLKAEPRDILQRKAIGFLVGEGDYKYTSKYSQLSLNLATGAGKTFCATAATSILKLKSMVIVNKNRIKNQWFDSYTDMTTLDKDRIYNIENSTKIKALLKFSKELPFYVYLVTHDTLNSYGNNYGWDSISELFNKIKIGVKIFDEAHRCFDSMIKIDAYTNTKKTFYLTANFERSEHRENKLFQNCFKNIPKYNQEERDGDNSKEHIVHISYQYNSHPSMDAQVSCKNKYGFNKDKYIDYLVNKDSEFFDHLAYLIDFFKDKDGSILIFVGKITACEIVSDFIKERFKDISVGIYNSKIPDKEKESFLDSKKIIVTTFKSLGEGADLKTLKYLINAEYYSSTITRNQLSGRLRKIDDKPSFYVEILNMGFKSNMTQYKERVRFFKKKFKAIHVIKK